MFSYNQQQQQNCPPELEALLKDRGPLIKILSLPATAQQLRAKHERLVEYLQDRKTMLELLDIVRNNTAKNLQRSIMGLFQTSTLVLSRVFADDLILMEDAIVKTLETDYPTKSFAVGTISRFLNRAFDQWPDECGEVCRVSKKIYQTAINHIDQCAVFQMVSDLMNENQRLMPVFIWHCFVALSGVKASPPPCACCERPVTVGPLGDVHRANLIELLRQFFEMRKGKDNKSKDPEFEAIVRGWAEKLKDEEFAPQIWDVLKLIPPEEKLAQRALKFSKEIDKNEFMGEKALGYLSECHQIVAVEEFVDVLQGVMGKKVGNAALVNWLQIVREVSEKSQEEEKKRFKQMMTKVIARYWDEVGDDRMKLSFLIEAGVCVKDAETDLKSWPGFIVFIDKWQNPDDDWSETTFSKELYSFKTEG